MAIAAWSANRLHQPDLFVAELPDLGAPDMTSTPIGCSSRKAASPPAFGGRLFGQLLTKRELVAGGLQVVDEDGLPVDETPPGDPVAPDRQWRQFERNRAEVRLHLQHAVAFEEDGRIVGVANASRSRRRREHRLDVGRRGGNGAKDRTGRGRCSSASETSRLRACTSSNRRTFSIAITAWSAKVSTSSICWSVNGFTVERVSANTPTGCPSRSSGTPSKVRNPASFCPSIRA